MKAKILKDCKDRMEGAMAALRQHFETLRTGRASLSLLDNIRVEAYGTPSSLNQVASLSTPDARTITIQPWDKSLTGPIEKAIMAANIGLTPNNDGTVIRLNIPPMTEERRRDVVKMAHKMSEEARVAVRNVRRHVNDDLKKTEKQSEISEDEMHVLLKEVQEMTDEHIKKVDQEMEKKEKEIMEV